MFKKSGSKKKDSHGSNLVSLLSHEIARAKKSQQPFGQFLLQVPADVPRGVHQHLPGRTLGYQQYPNYRRYLGVVNATRDDELVAARRVILGVGKERGWGVIAVGLALWPVNGRTANELLEWARFDAQRQVKAELAARSHDAKQREMKGGHDGSTSIAASHEPSPPPMLQAAIPGSTPASSNMPPLGRFLVQHGYVTDDQLHKALEVQRFQHASLGHLALRHGILDEQGVLEILTRQEETGELFGEAAIVLGRITSEQIERLLAEQRTNLPPLGQVLQKLGYLSSENLSLAITELSRMVEKSQGA